MVATYNIAGRQVGAHVLSMAVLGSTTFLTWLSLRGSGSKKTQTTPPIQASSKDEENFIQDFIRQAEAESKSKH